MPQRCYGGVRLLGSGPCLANVERLDAGAMPMILAMAERGMRVDLDHFAKMDIALTQDMDRITEEVRRMTGYYINLSSAPQKADLLFNKQKLGLKQARPKMTRSGSRESVEDEVLTAIQHDHPVVPLMLEYTEYDKLRGTYVRPMPKLAVRTSFGVWRMFPNFNTTRVPSGRLSCKDPNLLAMPTRTDRGKDIRRGFITDDGWVYVSADESQIEVRLAAHCSGDPNLIRVYEEKEDVYSDFAIDAFKLPDKRFRNAQGKWEYPGVDPMGHRYPAKTCILASIYDVTAEGLLEQMPVICATCNKPATCILCSQRKSHDIHIRHDCHKFVPLWTENKCQDIINAFYVKYYGVMRDRKKYHTRAMKWAYNWDMWGRLLHVAAVRSVLEYVVAAALRELANFPYQSGAQGTIKLTMAEVFDDLDTPVLSQVIHPLLQVHDELIFECREDIAQDLGELVCYRFENCVGLDVPIRANWVSANTWGDLEK